jgi:hypothetical protein
VKNYKSEKNIDEVISLNFSCLQRNSVNKIRTKKTENWYNLDVGSQETFSLNMDIVS